MVKVGIIVLPLHVALSMGSVSFLRELCEFAFRISTGGISDDVDKFVWNA